MHNTLLGIFGAPYLGFEGPKRRGMEKGLGEGTWRRDLGKRLGGGTWRSDLVCGCVGEGARGCGEVLAVAGAFGRRAAVGKFYSWLDRLVDGTLRRTFPVGWSEWSMARGAAGPRGPRCGMGDVPFWESGVILEHIG